jgi:hypothetical protein
VGRTYGRTGDILTVLHVVRREATRTMVQARAERAMYLMPMLTGWFGVIIGLDAGISVPNEIADQLTPGLDSIKLTRAGYRPLRPKSE